MSVYVLKIASLFLYPLSWIGLLLLLSLLAVWQRHYRLASGLLSATLIGLWVITMPVTGQWLMYQLEQQYPEQSIEHIPTADAILLLGGGIAGAAPPIRLFPDVNDSGDRIIYAATLYHAGKARKILVSGGVLAWKGVKQSEAESMKWLLMQLGVPAADIIEEARSQTTYENAVNSLAIVNALDYQHLLLVTSAIHMPRAMATIKKVMPDIELTPASTDVRITSIGTELLDWLPQASGLGELTEAWHEWLGWWVYRLKGQA